MTDWNELKVDLRYRTRHRRRFCHIVTFGHHWYGKEEDVEVRSWDGLTNEEIHNDVGFEKIGGFRQCRLCYETKAVSG